MNEQLSYIPHLSTQPLPGEEYASGGIDHTFWIKSGWIWPEEGGYPAPLVPGDVQRGKKVKQATILITVDDYFQLYINGILLHKADQNHDWRKPIAFSVPVQSTDKVVFAIRAINKYADIGLWQPSPAGLRATVQVHYADGTKSPVSYSAQREDPTWLSERLFPEGWHLTDFDDRHWKPAKEMPNQLANGSAWTGLQHPSTILVASEVPEPLGRL
ncbi:hypothetical protein BKA70DRAFT_1323656 [Coprinopsis sp. MPI-PUGE-AT-0042]|nr:hypothetical protein BKA70DRAFT_1323656 [Coprinopsis sp. MPI-PUGE-AT-0042]